MLGPLSAELSARRAATAAQLAEAARLVTEGGGLFPTRLVEVGVRPGDVLMALARISGLPPAPGSRLRFPAPGLAATAPGPALWSLVAAPFGLGANGLQVAFADPASAAAAKARLPPHQAFVALETDIRGALLLLFGDEPAPEPPAPEVAAPEAEVEVDLDLAIELEQGGETAPEAAPTPAAAPPYEPALAPPERAGEPAPRAAATASVEDEPGRGAAVVSFPQRRRAATPSPGSLPFEVDADAVATERFLGPTSGPPQPPLQPAAPPRSAARPGGWRPPVEPGPPPPSADLGSDLRTDVWRVPVEVAAAGPPPPATEAEPASDGRTGVWRVPTEAGPPPLATEAEPASDGRTGVWRVPTEEGPPPPAAQLGSQRKTDGWKPQVEAGPPPPAAELGSQLKTDGWKLKVEPGPPPPAGELGSEMRTDGWKIQVEPAPQARAPEPEAGGGNDGRTGIWRVPAEAPAQVAAPLELPMDGASDGRTGVWRVPVEVAAAGPPPAAASPSPTPVETSDGKTGIWRVPGEAPRPPSAGPGPEAASDGKTGVWRVPGEAAEKPLPLPENRDGKTGVWAPAKGPVEPPDSPGPRLVDGALVPPAKGPTVASTLEKLNAATSEGDVASALLGHAASWFGRILLLVLRDGQLCGLAGRGLARPAYETAALRIPPQLLAPGYEAAPQDRLLEPLWRIYGSRPEALLVLVVPTGVSDPWLLLADQPGVAARYADVQPLRILASAAAKALDRVRAR